MVGVIEKRLSVLMVRFKDDKDVLEILLKIATKTHSVEDVRLLTTILRRLYFMGSLSGYTFQSQIVRRVITRWGQTAATEYALRKAPVVIEKLVETLTLQPEYRGIVKTMIEDNIPREAFSEGQKEAGEEHDLAWKMWLRTSEPPSGIRRAHSVLEGTIIPRDELFVLPSGVRMWAPHDWNIPDAARENINCRHAHIMVPYATREEIRESLRR